MTETELQQTLEILDTALVQNNKKNLDAILNKCELKTLISSRSISLARLMKKNISLIFLCTLAVNNDINKEEATFWLAVYQSITAKKPLNISINSIIRV